MRNGPVAISDLTVVEMRSIFDCLGSHSPALHPAGTPVIMPPI